MTRLAAAIVLALAIPLAARGDAQEGGGPSDDVVTVFEDSFDGAEVGGPPPGWILGGPYEQGSYRAEVRAGAGAGGSDGAVLEIAEGQPESFGNLMRSAPAEPFVGRRVRLQASVRTDGTPGAKAMLWLRVDYEGGSADLIDNMTDRPHTSRDWATYFLEGAVFEGALSITYGSMLHDGGAAFLDDVRLESVADPALRIEPEEARPVTDGGLANLIAFARLYGYVRFFHPSDACEEADWDAAAMRGVRAAEAAESPEALAAALQAWVEPLAPTVRVFADGADPGELHAALGRPDTDERLYVYRWQHRGVKMGEGRSAYSSWRSRKRVRDEGLPEGFADPREPFEASLGGGLSCRVPLALYGDAEKRTFPLAEGDRAAIEAAANRPSGDDRTTRLAAVVIAWNVFQHFYPYFDLAGTDWAAELPRALRAAAEDGGERDFLETLRLLVAALRDGHGSVRHRSDPNTGTLPFALAWIEDGLVVTAVGQGAGELAPGDEVIAIDGVAAAECLERAEELISSSTPQWKRHRALYDVVSGSKGEGASIRYVSAETGETKETVAIYASGQPPAMARPEVIEELEPGLWYVDLDRLTSAAWLAAVDDLATASGIVFDMRGYPSRLDDPAELFRHLVQEPIESAKWCFPVVDRPDVREHEYARSNWTIAPQEPYLAAKKAFLVHGGAISYAESCMGIVEHYGLAEIVGEATAGTNGNINPFVLPGGYTVVWTGMRVDKHDGSPLHGVGIVPTIPVEPTRASIAAGRDLVLERGIEAVKD